MAIAALVVGIAAMVFAFTLGLNLLAPILGIAGIILAVAARKEEKSPASTAGLILSIIGLVLGLLSWMVCALCTAGWQKVLDNPEFQKTFQETREQLNRQAQDAMKKIEDTTKKTEELPNSL